MHAGCGMRSPAALCPAPGPQRIHHLSFSASLHRPVLGECSPPSIHPLLAATLQRGAPPTTSLVLPGTTPFPTTAPHPSLLLYSTYPLYCGSAFACVPPPLTSCNACALPPAWVHKELVTDLVRVRARLSEASAVKSSAVQGAGAPRRQTRRANEHKQSQLGVGWGMAGSLELVLLPLATETGREGRRVGHRTVDGAYSKWRLRRLG